MPMTTSAAAASPSAVASTHSANTPTARAAKEWNGWMAPERDRAPGDLIAGWLHTAASKGLDLAKEVGGAVKERIDLLGTGKRFLDEGGEIAQQGILAKKVSMSVVAADQDVMDRLRLLAKLNSDQAAFSLDPAKREALMALAGLYSRGSMLLDEPPPPAPTWGSDVERDAGAIMQFRTAKAAIGRQLWNGAETVIGGPLFSGRANPFMAPGVGAPSRPPTRQAQSLEDLMRELFKMQDLNANGVLEEEELIKLNEKIEMLHYGKGVDKAAIKEKYTQLFRKELNAEGQPVPYDVFRTYMVQVLHELDPDPRGQTMILEQFIAEAESAREAFQFASFVSMSDQPFLSKLGIDQPLFPSAKAAADAMAGETPPIAAPASEQPVLSMADQVMMAQKQSSASVASGATSAPIASQSNGVGKGNGGGRGGYNAAPTASSSSGASVTMRATRSSGSAGAAQKVVAKEETAVVLAYAEGDKVQVWSNTKKAWTDAKVVDAFDRTCFTEGYAVPAGSYKVSSAAGVKWVMPEQVAATLRRIE
mmetsp:Transcript_48765/g.136448  ORF Transcript_48765/g.136448 Transcript_48765/m.136448 type:complete len:535 (-) Transcript_48765:90-1694(-)